MHYTIFDTPVVNVLMHWLARLILRLTGWRILGGVPAAPKYVLIAAPHTSNWDFPVALMVCFALRLRVYWMGKASLFPPLLGAVLEHIENLFHIFSEAARTLTPRGRFFINELHPFKQYKGTKARFEKGAETIEVEAFVHHISDFTNAADSHGFSLIKLNQYWHEGDGDKPPRIVSFIFEKV